MFEVTSRRYVLDTPYVRILEKKVKRDASGQLHDYYEVVFPDFCNVVALTPAKEVVMVRQFRAGLEAPTLEIPGGLVETGDGGPGTSALRELREETGYGLAEGAQVVELGWTHPNPAIQANRCHFYLAGPVELKGPPTPDPGEDIEVVLLPFQEIAACLQDGRMTHALMWNAFHWIALRQQKRDPLLRPFAHLLS